MSLNGIWKVEIIGPYGWETTSTAFLEDGKFRSGSRNHYTIGNYEISDNRVEITAEGVQYGKARVVFGKKKEKMNVKFKGEIDGNRIKGQVLSDEGAHKIAFRITRLTDLP